MNFSQLLAAIETALTPLAQAAGGDVTVAESLEKAHAFMDGAPRRWRVILHWEGYGEHAAARLGMTTHQVATVIQAPTGLRQAPSPIDAAPGCQAMSDLITMVSGWMLAIRLPDGTGADVAGFSLASSQWLQSVPQVTSHVCSWRLPAALPPRLHGTIDLVFLHLEQ